MAAAQDSRIEKRYRQAEYAQWSLLAGLFCVLAAVSFLALPTVMSVGSWVIPASAAAAVIAACVLLLSVLFQTEADRLQPPRPGKK